MRVQNIISGVGGFFLGWGFWSSQLLAARLLRSCQLDYAYKPYFIIDSIQIAVFSCDDCASSNKCPDARLLVDFLRFPSRSFLRRRGEPTASIEWLEQLYILRPSTNTALNASERAAKARRKLQCPPSHLLRTHASSLSSSSFNRAPVPASSTTILQIRSPNRQVADPHGTTMRTRHLTPQAMTAPQLLRMMILLRLAGAQDGIMEGDR